MGLRMKNYSSSVLDCVNLTRILIDFMTDHALCANNLDILFNNALIFRMRGESEMHMGNWLLIWTGSMGLHPSWTSPFKSFEVLQFKNSSYFPWHPSLCFLVVVVWIQQWLLLCILVLQHLLHYIVFTHILPLMSLGDLVIYHLRLRIMILTVWLLMTVHWILLSPDAFFCTFASQRGFKC